MPTITGFSHIALTVTDVDKSFDWYERLLGVQKLFDSILDGMRVCTTFEPGSQTLLTLRHHDSTVAEPFDESRVGLDHLAFQVANRAGLDDWKDRLEELGVDHSEIKDMDYGSVLTFRDPDNIQLEFFALPS